MITPQALQNTTPERGWWLSEPASDRMAFGMILHQVNGDWTVARTLIGSPAEAAGIVAGERLIAVDEYEVGIGRGDMYEMQLLMLADKSNTHVLSLQSSAGLQRRTVKKAPLRTLLEVDYDSGGATLGSCVGCRTCRPLTIGATDCSSGCPGNYCTVG
jgi:predicted metalloprotease with PDZ domain